MSACLEPATLVASAKGRWKPLKTFCLYSGGGDSGVLAHLCRDDYDALLYIDTGTAIPTEGEPAILGVEDHARTFARELQKPLVVRRSGEAFRTMVLGDDLWWSRFRHEAACRKGDWSIEQMIAEDKRAGRTSSKQYGNAPYGFPGKGHHGKAYSRLKERRIEEVLRETKAGHSRSSTVLFLSGIRRAESRRRARREPFSVRGSAKFCSPLIDWTAADMEEYRARFGLPQSDVAALLHRSGECNCGAFARAEEERALMQTFWPAWWAATVEALEAEAEARGIRWCRWGGYDVAGNQAAGRSAERVGVMCASCTGRSFEGEGALGATPGGDPRATPQGDQRATPNPCWHRVSPHCRRDSADAKTLKSPRQSRVRL